jgi:hypothetical protein
VFLVNLPIVAFGLLAGVFLIPTQGPSKPRSIPSGACCRSRLGALLYGIIEAPTTAGPTGHDRRPRSSRRAPRGFAWWELPHRPPDARLRVLQEPALQRRPAPHHVDLLAMFGSLFVFTQYLQFVLGYSPLQTGVSPAGRSHPMMIIAPLSAASCDASAPRSSWPRHGPHDAGPVLLSFVAADSSYPSSRGAWS